MQNVTIDSKTGNIVIRQGTTCAWAYEFLNANVTVNIANWTCRAQVRSSYDAPTAVLTLSIDNGKITRTPGNASFLLQLLPADTSALRFTGKQLDCVYDVEVVDPDGKVTRIAEGKFTILREVTR